MTRDERRHYQRLPIPANTVATDTDGHVLGRVTLAGGGGFQLEDLSEEGDRELQPGRRVRITVVEPGIGARHTVDVEVRYRHGDAVGLQFVGSAAAG